MVDAMKVKRSIYFATLQGHVIFETELYINQDHLGLMLVLIFFRLLICIIVDIIVLICSFIKQIVSQSEVKFHSFVNTIYLMTNNVPTCISL